MRGEIILDNDDVKFKGSVVFRQFGRLLFIGGLIVLLLAIPLLVASMGMGWLLHRLSPSIEFGLSVLICLTALGFVAVMALSLFISLTKTQQSLDDDDDLRPIYVLPDSPTTLRRKKPRWSR